MRLSPVLAALMAGSALCPATEVAAQDTCDLLQSRSSTVQLTRNGFFNFISDPVFGCGGGVIIRADSAVLDDVSGYTRFIGNFEYRDSTAFMTADRADHFASAGRLIGVGNVHIIDGSTGATFEGDSTVLVGSGSRRDDGEMTIVGRDGRRAHAMILVSPAAAAPDSTETPSDSAQVAGDAAEVADSAARPADDVATDSVSAEDSTGVASGAAAGNPEGSSPPADSAAVPPETPAAPVDAPAPPARDTTPIPYDIDAERIYLRGAGYMRATGSAELYNDEFRALADSIEYLEETGKLFLRGTAPRVFGYGADYVLSGGAVDLDMDGNQVAARGDAALSGSEIDLTAPEIRVLMRNGVLDRIVAMNEQPPEPELPGPPGGADMPAGDSAAAVAAAGEAPDDARTEPVELVAAEAVPLGEQLPVEGTNALGTTPGETGDSPPAPPPARPRAVAETFELEGDSIDVLAPGEVLERVVAVGGARGESLARDSLNAEKTPEIARSDWVLGDTITAVFRPAGVADTSTEAGAEPDAGDPDGGHRLDRLVARGQAASLYRMTPSDGAAGGEGEEEEGEGPEALQEPTEQAGGEEAAPEAEPDNRLALHYVRGDLITIFMQDGEVTSVIVEGNARGVQLEPVAVPAPPSDTTAAPPATRR